MPDSEAYLLPKLEEHLDVPRLHDSMTCDEIAIMPGVLCRCEHCRAAFAERYGIDGLVSDLEAVHPPATGGKNSTSSPS